MRRSAAFQAMKRYNNVQLAEETVGYCQAHALDRVRTCNQNTAEIFGDYKYNTYDADKIYEVRFLQSFFLWVCDWSLKQVMSLWTSEFCPDWGQC